MLIALNKPYGVVCQFSGAGLRPTLKDFVGVPGVYPAGRLDHDSEGLLLLTDVGTLQHAVADPGNRIGKRYWVQVEGDPEESALAQLRQGVSLRDGISRAESARHIEEPAGIWPRDPPIRMRRNIPTSWLEIVLREGRNRQVRRSTAAIGYPTLRLIRVAIGPLDLFELGLLPGQWTELPSQALGILGSTPRHKPSAHERASFRQPPRGSRR